MAAHDDPRRARLAQALRNNLRRRKTTEQPASDADAASSREPPKARPDASECD